AALELRALELDFITGIQVGISQGRMRTGAYGGVERRTYGAIGDDVNLAARLMQAAQPGQILVSQPVHQAAGGSVIWEQLPDITVKGKTGAVAVYSLEGAGQRHSAYLQEPRYTLPMVGRAAELALIGQKLEEARLGKGQIVGIRAEAGMGKSRLVAAAIQL